MKRLIPILTIAAIALLAALPAQAAAYRTAAQIEGDIIRLGDVLLGAGDAADAVVAAAPAPGESVTISHFQIAETARQSGLDITQPSMGYVTVERLGNPVDGALLEDRIRNALLDYGLEGPMAIRLTNLQRPIYVPVGADPSDLIVSGVQHDERTGRFSVTAAYPGDRGNAAQTSITGVAEPQIEVPVLRRPLQPGDVIDADDLSWTAVAARRVNRTMITDPAMLIGRTPVRSVRAESPLRLNDVERPILVEKGALATMVMQRGRMVLTAVGKAMEDGADGDFIRLRNTSTNRTVEGVVSGPNRVSILSPETVAAIDR